MWEFQQDIFQGLPINRLKVDRAFLNITSTVNKRLWIYQLSDECVSCPFKKLRKLGANRNSLERIDTSTLLSWSIYDSNSGPYAYNNKTPLCIVQPENLGQFGVYNLTINEDGCKFDTVKPPVNTNLSIFLVVAIIAFFFGFFKYGKVLLAKYFRKPLDEPATSTSSTSQLDRDNDTILSMYGSEQLTKPVSSSRLRSLDTLRGLAIIAMIFANTGSGKYFWFEHVAWNGIHPADFIFPAFLWIMGVCIPMSIKSQMTRNIPRMDMVQSILIRSLKLFLIGFFVHTAYGPTINQIRIMGVLQRFGIVYLIIATLYVFLGKPMRNEQDAQGPSWKLQFLDVITLLPQWIIIFAIILIHLLIIFFLPIPNCPTGYLGPGGIHEMGRFNNCIGGATGYIDRMLLGENHLYQRPRAGAVYDERRPYDPEGLFGCLVSVVHVFFGVQCGQTMLYYTDWKDRLKRWIVWGCTTIFIGLCLCKFSINDGLIPINKNLWSLSYVMVTTGFAFLLLTVFYYIIDVRKWWSGKPLFYAGMNAIVMYAGSELLDKMYPFYWRFDGMNTHFMFLLANIWEAAMWNLVAYYLCLRKIFISL